MVHSPSWEANWFAASQEIPQISRNPKVHYRTHKRPPPVSILGYSNPFHTPTSHLLEIRPNIIHPSMPRSPQWSPSLRFPHLDPTHPSVLTHTRQMFCLHLQKLSYAVGHYAMLRERVVSGSELTNFQYHSRIILCSFQHFNTAANVVLQIHVLGIYPGSVIPEQVP